MSLFMKGGNVRIIVVTDEKGEDDDVLWGG